MLRSEKIETSTKEFKDPRFLIAISVLGFSIVGVILLAYRIITKGTDENSTQYVFGAMLPLLGTWVGTVLAYYFSKENFESASKSVREMAKQLTPMEKLESIPLRLKMIPRDQMAVYKIKDDKPLDKIKIVEDILEKLKKAERNRLPILDKNECPKYIIHRSMIDKFLSQKTFEEGLSVDEIKKLYFKEHLLDKDLELRNLFETGFVTIKEDASLADAKIEMNKVKNCLDLFITKNGTKNEPVIGWVTNLIITENAKL